MSDDPTYGDLILSAVNAFDYAGLDTPQMAARLLLMEVAGISHTGLISCMNDSAPEDIQLRFSGFVARRLANEPVHRIIGKREFYGREFVLGPEALIPRPDTETLIDAVLSNVEDRMKPLQILDVGTGSGIIAVTLACELSRSQVIAVDISESALENCQDNARLLGVKDRVQTLHSDMFNAVEGQYDLIVSNPPYIPTNDLDGLAPEVRLHDPASALDGGEDGLDFYRQIFATSANFLNNDGTLVLEFGIDQSEQLKALADAHAFKLIEIHMDLGGIPRVMVASL